MSGLETASIVLAVIPLLVPALDLYKNGLSRASVFFRRRKHVEKLIHSLHLQKTLLTENVRSLLIRVVSDVDDIPEDPQQLFELLRNDDDLKERVDAYLGIETNELYKHAVVTCEEVVRNIAAHIEGFLPAGQLVRFFAGLKLYPRSLSCAAVEAWKSECFHPSQWTFSRQLQSESALQLDSGSHGC